jgi:hypothetical protein
MDNYGIAYAILFKSVRIADTFILNSKFSILNYYDELSMRTMNYLKGD